MPDEITLEDLSKSVHDLSESVVGLREGLVDRETVETIAAEVSERQAAHQREADRSNSYRPADHAPDLQRLGGSPEQRIAEVHTRDAGYVARMTGMSEDTVREFQRRADDVLLLETIMTQGGRRSWDVRESGYYRDEFAPLVRAMDTATSGEGTEWVPREMSGELIQRVSLQLRVAGLFRLVQQPTPVFDFPAVGVSRVRTGVHAEQTADSGQSKFKALTPSTRKVTLTAKKLAARVLVSKEAEEDAIVAILPWIRDEIVDYLAADLEDALINGDTAASHQDVDVSASDDPRVIWDGLRKLTQSGEKADGGSDALAVADLRANRKAMGKYGILPASLAHIVSMSGYIDLLSDEKVTTVDKFGPQATILNGQLASVDGTPIIVSEFVRQDLNATGVYDGTTETQSVALTVNTSAFIQGERRGVTTEFLRELYAESDQDAVIASMRRSFAPLYPTTESIVALTYNVDA